MEKAKKDKQTVIDAQKEQLAQLTAKLTTAEKNLAAQTKQVATFTVQVS